MKKSLTYSQLKKIIMESIMAERNDEKPVTLSDVPIKLMSELKKLGCELEDGTAIRQGLPYIYVFMPVTGDHVPKKAVTRAVEAAGWHIIDTEPPYEGEPRFTFWISPYKKPHEPGLDQFDAMIDAMEEPDD